MEIDAMNQKEAMELANECVEELAETLREEEPESLTRYLDAMAKFHRYSLGNLLMIIRQRPDAEQVAGFRAWKELGRWVRPGEKGIAIMAPMVRRQKQQASAESSDTKQPDESAQPGEASDSGEKDAKRRLLKGFRVVHVFDVKQTDGAELPQLSELQGDPGASLDSLIQVFRTLGIGIVHGTLPMGTQGASFGGRVMLTPGMDPVTEFQVLAHELAHELLHQGTEGLQRDLAKRVLETEAEAVAYVVCKANGIDAVSVSNEYIRMHQGDAKTIEESFTRIRGAAAMILSLMAEADEARRVRRDSRRQDAGVAVTADWSHAA